MQSKDLNLLPLVMFKQLNDVLLLRKMYSEEKSIDLPDFVEMKKRDSDVYKLKKRGKLEKGRKICNP